MKYEWFHLKNLEEFNKIQIKFWDIEGRFLYTRLNGHMGEAYMTVDIRKKCNVDGNISSIPFGLVQVYYLIKNFWSYGLKDVVLVDNLGKQHHYKYKKYELTSGGQKLNSKNWINNLDQVQNISILLSNGEWINLRRTGAALKGKNNKTVHIKEVLNLVRYSTRVTIVDNSGYYHTFDTV